MLPPLLLLAALAACCNDDDDEIVAAQCATGADSSACGAILATALLVPLIDLRVSSQLARSLARSPQGVTRWGAQVSQSPGAQLKLATIYSLKTRRSYGTLCVRARARSLSVNLSGGGCSSATLQTKPIRARTRLETTSRPAARHRRCAPARPPRRRRRLTCPLSVAPVRASARAGGSCVRARNRRRSKEKVHAPCARVVRTT